LGVRVQNQVSAANVDYNNTAVDLVDVTSMADRVLDAVGAKCCCDKAKGGVAIETVTSGAKHILGKAGDYVSDYVPVVDLSKQNEGKHTGQCVVVEKTDLGKIRGVNRVTGAGSGCGSLPKSFYEEWTSNKLHDYTKTGGKCDVSADDLDDILENYAAELSCKRHGTVVACLRVCTGKAMESASVMQGKEGEKVAVSCPTNYAAEVKTVNCGRDGKFSPRPKCVKGR